MASSTRVNSVLETGFLLAQLSEQLRNAVATIDAEFKRREEAARKKDEEKRKCEEDGRKDCA